MAMTVRGRPQVALNMAMTLDGKVMRPDGAWYGLTSPVDRARMELFRRECDVVIVGKNSVIADDPVVASGARPVPCMIARGSLPPADRKLFANPQARPILLVGADQPDLAHVVQTPAPGRPLQATDLDPVGAPAALRELVQRADLIALPRELLEPASVLDWLYRERAARRVLLEGGPQVNHAFFAADLVDVIYLTIVPYLIGARDLPGIVDGEAAFARFDRPGWCLDRCEPVGQEVFLQYVRVRS
jgi:riboflavin-specific deaminase-like protein